MSGIRIKKEEKHDYATFGEKIQRKIHKSIYKLLGDYKKAYPFYRSYRHRTQKPELKNDRDGYEFLYMTERPAYMAGFGHGLGAWRAGLMNAKRFGISYAYTPMVNRDWEEALGLGESFPDAKELLRQGYKKILLPYYDMNDPVSRNLVRSILDSYRGEKVVFYNEYEQWTAAGDDIEGDKIVRKLFWESGTRKKDRLIYQPGKLNIALHIRRGDVSSRLSGGDTSMKKRWLELSYYSSLMKQFLETVTKPEDLRFYVFSEGEEKDFEELKQVSSNITFCLDMSAERSFVHLCYADLLVTAPSSFSIVAGAIQKGIKIVPERDWLTIPDTEEWVRADCESGRLLTGDKIIKEYLMQKESR